MKQYLDYVTVLKTLKYCGLNAALEAIQEFSDSQNEAIRDLITDLLKPALRYTGNDRPGNVLRLARAYARGCATKEELRSAWWDCTEGPDKIWGSTAKIERAIACATMFCCVDDTRAWVSEAAKQVAEILVDAGNLETSVDAELVNIVYVWAAHQRDLIRMEMSL